MTLVTHSCVTSTPCSLFEREILVEYTDCISSYCADVSGSMKGLVSRSQGLKVQGEDVPLKLSMFFEVGNREIRENLEN